MRAVGLSGNITRPSRTRGLVEAICAEVAQREGWSAEAFDLLDAGPQLGATVSRETSSKAHARLWEAVETCDLLVVASPVYKASYSGLLKHFFDLFDMKALAGRTVLLGATGKAPQHALMIEHQMRPLFGFFGAWSVPQGLFLVDADFETDTDGRNVPGGPARARIAAAVDQALERVRA